MENISRRHCLKLIGSLSGIILLNNLTGCKKEEDNWYLYQNYPLLKGGVSR